LYVVTKKLPIGVSLKYVNYVTTSNNYIQQTFKQSLEEKGWANGLWDGFQERMLLQQETRFQIFDITFPESWFVEAAEDQKEANGFQEDGCNEKK